MHPLFREPLRYDALTWLWLVLVAGVYVLHLRLSTWVSAWAFILAGVVVSSAFVLLVALIRYLVDGPQRRIEGARTMREVLGIDVLPGVGEWGRGEPPAADEPDEATSPTTSRTPWSSRSRTPAPSPCWPTSATRSRSACPSPPSSWPARRGRARRRARTGRRARAGRRARWSLAARAGRRGRHPPGRCGPARAAAGAPPRAADRGQRGADRTGLARHRHLVVRGRRHGGRRRPHRLPAPTGRPPSRCGTAARSC